MDFGAVGAVLLNATDSMVENEESADYVDIWIFNNISLCNPWTQSPFLFMPLNFFTKSALALLKDSFLMTYWYFFH